MTNRYESLPVLSKAFLYGWALVVGTLVHVDWHFARAGHHRSLDWPYHWLLGVAGAALLAVLIARKPNYRLRATFDLITIAGFILGQIVEPLLEVAFFGESFRELYGGGRWSKFSEFGAAWMITGSVIIFLALRRPKASATA